jgi:hypothetical protein
MLLFISSMPLLISALIPSWLIFTWLHLFYTGLRCT